jgi:peptide/nickel transport system substrate-binding protein
MLFVVETALLGWGVMERTDRPVSRRDLLGWFAGAALVSVVPSLLTACRGGDEEPGTATTVPATQPASSPPVTTPAGEIEPSSTDVVYTEANPRWFGREISPAGQVGGTLAEGFPDDPSSLNPMFATDRTSYYVFRMIYDALFDTHLRPSEPAGNLVTSQELSEDALQWTFTLRDDVRWHDGEPFTSADVVFSYTLFGNPEIASFTQRVNLAVAAVEAPDDWTVVFTLHAPAPEFIADYCIWPILAKHVLETVPPAELGGHASSTGSDPALVVGTGPFVFEQWTQGESISAVRNDSYWDGVPHLDRWVARVIQDPAAQVNQLLSGQIDFLSSAPLSSVEQLEEPEVVLTAYDSGSMRYVGFNLDPEKSTLFQDLRVRQALIHAIDRQAIVETVRFGYGTVTPGLYGPMAAFYTPEAITIDYPYDPEKAAALLDEAGWAVGPGGLRELDGAPVTVTLVCSTMHPEAPAIQEFWRKVGVETEIVALPTQQFFERAGTLREFDAVINSSGITSGPDQTWLVGCDSFESGGNRVRYCNPEVDALLEEGKVELDIERRRAIYVELQNLVLADAPFGVLYFAEEVAAFNTRVHNLFPDRLGGRFNAETWWVES